MEAVTPIRVYRVGKRSFKPEWGQAVQVRYYDIVVNGEKITEVSAVPVHLKELAMGFLHSNGYIEDPGTVEGITVEDGEIKVTASPDFEFRMRYLRERGVEPLELIDLSPVTSPFSVTTEKIYEKLASVMNNARNLPYSIISDVNGYLFFSEDVHPQNSFYKVVGRAVFDHFDLRSSFIVISHHILPEDVVRAAYLGIPILGSFSGTSDLAASVAESLGVTLFGITLDGLEVFTYPSRIKT